LLMNRLGTPAAEFSIDEALVAELLAAQHPDLADKPLRAVDSGWDNAMFRLGDELAVRLPRRAIAGTIIQHEQRWLPELAPRLSIPVPVPCRIGKPASGYPCNWSVVPWIKGVPADECAPETSEASVFARFLCALHTPAPPDAPSNSFRGVPLHQRVSSVDERIARLATRTQLISPAIKSIWRQALSAPLDYSKTWLHGDLHPRNVLVEAGQITGVIDWGDITAGDCAADLASIWSLFSASEARQEALATYNVVTEATLHRAQGWAVLFGVMLLDTGLVDDPRHATIGERILRRLVEDFKG
jgi:aminoglycoside phosphotransferase (APT) family kinase protein